METKRLLPAKMEPVIADATVDKCLSIEGGNAQFSFGSNSTITQKWLNGDKVIVPAGVNVWGMASPDSQSVTVIIADFGV